MQVLIYELFILHTHKVMPDFLKYCFHVIVASFCLIVVHTHINAI